MAIFMSVEVVSIIIIVALLLTDGHLRRRDTVESKRIFNIAILVVIGSLINIVSTLYDWFWFEAIASTSKLLAVLIIGAFCLIKEMMSLQVVVGWNLFVDYAIYKSYDHVLKKEAEPDTYCDPVGFVYCIICGL